jgi:hypothetical protein
MIRPFRGADRLQDPDLALALPHDHHHDEEEDHDGGPGRPGQAVQRDARHAVEVPDRLAGVGQVAGHAGHRAESTLDR